MGWTSQQQGSTLSDSGMSSAESKMASSTDCARSISRSAFSASCAVAGQRNVGEGGQGSVRLVGCVCVCV